MQSSSQSLLSMPPKRPLNLASHFSLKDGADITSHGYRTVRANSVDFNLSLDDNELAETALIFVDCFLRNPAFALQTYLMNCGDPRSAVIAIALSKATTRSN